MFLILMLLITWGYMLVGTLLTGQRRSGNTAGLELSEGDENENQEFPKQVVEPPENQQEIIRQVAAAQLLAQDRFKESILNVDSAPSVVLSRVPPENKEHKDGQPSTTRTLGSMLQFGFVFATGRCGTMHLSKVFSEALNEADAFITHQTEDDNLPTKLFVDRYYREIVSNSSSYDEFQKRAVEFVRKNRLPWYLSKLTKNHRAHARHQAKLKDRVSEDISKEYRTKFIYTGHLPSAFGLSEALISELPGKVSILRVRRERIALALSLMALGPENEDSWSYPWVKDDGTKIGKLAPGSSFGPRTSLRWFPTPWDAHVLLKPKSVADWNRLNRFQKYLWYVDDMECRWQALLNTLESNTSKYADKVQVMEVDLETLGQISFRQAIKSIATFWGGLRYDSDTAAYRHNTIQQKKRSKANSIANVESNSTNEEELQAYGGEAELRTWDTEYKVLFSHGCEIAPGNRLTWLTMGS